MGKKADTAEITIGRYLDSDEWLIETNDKTTAASLRRKGWTTQSPAEGPYWSFLVPLKAVNLRSAKIVAGYAQRARTTGFAKAARSEATNAAPVSADG